MNPDENLQVAHSNCSDFLDIVEDLKNSQPPDEFHQYCFKEEAYESKF